MKIKFILKESENIPDSIKQKFNFAPFEPPKEITEKWKYKPDWIPEQLTDKFLYNSYRKYGVKLKDNQMKFENGTFMYEHDEDRTLFSIIIPKYMKSLSVLIQIFYNLDGMVDTIYFDKYDLIIVYNYQNGKLAEKEWLDDGLVVKQEIY